MYELMWFPSILNDSEWFNGQSQVEKECVNELNGSSTYEIHTSNEREVFDEFTHDIEFVYIEKGLWTYMCLFIVFLFDGNGVDSCRNFICTKLLKLTLCVLSLFYRLSKLARTSGIIGNHHHTINYFLVFLDACKYGIWNV